LVSQYSPLPGGPPSVNGLKTYVTANLLRYLIVFDALGNLYIENSPGSLSVLVAGAAKAGLYLASTTYFGREYMAFSDGMVGQDLPRQYDGLNYDRVSQVGPGEGPSAADTGSGNISPGVHQVSVVFVTRQGYLDRALAANFLDGSGWREGERHQHSHRSRERSRALAGIHSIGRRELLQRAGDDDHQRQHHYFAHRRFHRRDSAFRHQHGTTRC